jgi:hypothetical protein
VISATVNSLQAGSGFFGFLAFDGTAPDDTAEPVTTVITTASTNAPRRTLPIAPPSLRTSQTHNRPAIYDSVALWA